MKKGRKAKPAEDFMGHVFPSFADMAAYWGLPVQRIRDRLHKGWTLKRALMKPLRGCQFKIADPETGEVLNEKEYAQKVGVSLRTFYYRRRNKVSKDLTYSPMRLNSIPAKDHTGRVFSSMSEMCRFWGIDYQRFHFRFTQAGWDIKKALTAPVQRKGRRPHEQRCQNATH